MGQTSKTKAPSKARPDRSHYQEGEEYPVRELAVATGISVDEAEALVEKHGVSSGKAAQEARVMQREQDAAEEDVRR